MQEQHSKTKQKYLDNIIAWLSTADEISLKSLEGHDAKTARNLYHQFKGGMEEALRIAGKHFEQEEDQETLKKIATYQELLKQPRRPKREKSEKEGPGREERRQARYRGLLEQGKEILEQEGAINSRTLGNKLYQKFKLFHDTMPEIEEAIKNYAPENPDRKKRTSMSVIRLGCTYESFNRLGVQTSKTGEELEAIIKDDEGLVTTKYLKRRGISDQRIEDIRKEHRGEAIQVMNEKGRIKSTYLPLEALTEQETALISQKTETKGASAKTPAPETPVAASVQRNRDKERISNLPPQQAAAYKATNDEGKAAVISDLLDWERHTKRINENYLKKEQPKLHEQVIKTYGEFQKAIEDSARTFLELQEPKMHTRVQRALYHEQEEQKKKKRKQSIDDAIEEVKVIVEKEQALSSTIIGQARYQRLKEEYKDMDGIREAIAKSFEAHEERELADIARSKSRRTSTPKADKNKQLRATTHKYATQQATTHDIGPLLKDYEEGVPLENIIPRDRYINLDEQFRYRPGSLNIQGVGISDEGINGKQVIGQLYKSFAWVNHKTLKKIGYDDKTLDELTIKHINDIYIGGRPRDEKTTRGTYFPITLFSEEEQVTIMEGQASINDADKRTKRFQRKDRIVDGLCNYLNGFEPWGVTSPTIGRIVAEAGYHNDDWVRLEDLMEGGLEKGEADKYKRKLQTITVRNTKGFDGIYVEKSALSPEHQKMKLPVHDAEEFERNLINDIMEHYQGSLVRAQSMLWNAPSYEKAMRRRVNGTIIIGEETKEKIMAEIIKQQSI